MGLVSGLVAQVLHIALMGVAAPSLIGIYRWMQARLAGRVGPPLLQPWLGPDTAAAQGAHAG